jgi:hypothetical protein
MKPTPTRRNIWDALEVGPLRLSEIASRSGVPLRFCQQMVWQMKREGFLKQRIKCHYERAQ